MVDEQGGRGSTPRVDIGPFTKIPHRLFGSGRAALLGPSATLLLIALCDHANRNGGNTFSASDRALAADTALSPRTIFNARKRLREFQMLSAERENGRSYRYTLPKFEMDWVPIKDRPRAKKRARALYANTNGTLAKLAAV